MNTKENGNQDDLKVPLTPGQRSGRAIDAKASSAFSSEQTASLFFALVRNRLQHVNSWSIMAGKLSAEFQIVNKDGLEVFREAHDGDYLRVDIFGPGGRAGQGFDWVKIEQMEDNPDGGRYGFRVRPASRPTSHHSNGPDHFYDKESTSTFMVVREGSRVTVTISDRNIKPNTHSDNVVDGIRNTVVAWAARARFSEVQWQSLADGLMSKA